ncbi:hypothetical protein Aduo_017844 [Ancylostoma duodenale]
MNSFYFFVAFIVAISQRTDASFPFAYMNDYPSFGLPHMHGHFPYFGAVAAPAPYVHHPVHYMHAAPIMSAPAVLPHHAAFSAFPAYTPHYYPARKELRNVAGAIQREKELLTDVTLRIPLRRKLAALRAHLQKNFN